MRSFRTPLFRSRVETHEIAKSAIEGLNDEERVRAAIEAATANQTEPKAKELVQLITAKLFQRGGGGLHRQKVLRASWASPRSERTYRHRDDRYFDDENDIVDDCPGGLDRGQWDAYCEGRRD